MGGLNVEKESTYAALARLCLIAAGVLALTVGATGVANAKAKNKDNLLHNGYGCLGVDQVVDFSFLFEFVPDGKGAIKSGLGTLSGFPGEDCTFTVDPTGSSYTVGLDGTGTLTIHYGTVTDLDGDSSGLCAEFTGATAHYVIVVESGGKRLDFSGIDPEFTGGGFTATDGDFDPVYGTCNRQVGG